VTWLRVAHNASVNDYAINFAVGVIITYVALLAN
jgi:hypothetical protein